MHVLRAAPIIALALLAAGAAFAQEAVEPNADREAIEANIAAYTKAYIARDASALAAFWSESGECISPLSGKPIQGRKNIEKEYADMFAEAGELALEVELESIRFITDDVAVEEGIAKVIFPGELPSDSRYRVIHHKVDGEWLIDSVRETMFSEGQGDEAWRGAADGKAEVIPQMKALSWMVGDWVDQLGEGSAIYYKCAWGLGMNFMRREFSVELGDQVEMDGIEVIGWDPAAETYRSWVFDSQGGFGSAIWERDGDTWTKNLTGTTRDGRKAFASHTMVKIDDDSYEWRAHGRVLDGKLLPNIETVTVTRLGAEQ